jgi:hypothetical protein
LASTHIFTSSGPGGINWHATFGSDPGVGATVTSCYPDCDGSGTLTVADFGCFQTRFVLQDPYADCNGAGGFTVADFGCFQTAFVAGCP